MPERQFSLGGMDVSTYDVPTGTGIQTERQVKIYADGERITLSMAQWRVLREAAIRLGPDCVRPVMTPSRTRACGCTARQPCLQHC